MHMSCFTCWMSDYRLNLLVCCQDHIGALLHKFADELGDATAEWTQDSDEPRRKATVWDAIRYVEGCQHDWSTDNEAQSFRLFSDGFVKR